MSNQKFWEYPPIGEKDDFGDKIKDIVIDGGTNQGPWAMMTAKSYKKHGRWPGKFGPGIAQEYKKQPDGKWLKIKG